MYKVQITYGYLEYLYQYIFPVSSKKLRDRKLMGETNIISEESLLQYGKYYFRKPVELTASVYNSIYP